MKELTPCNMFASALCKDEPVANAWINGNSDNPDLFGIVSFYSTSFGGVVINAEIYGLPDNESNFYGMHIHEFGNCIPPFDKTGNHYNPYKTPHPEHAGDMPPLLGNNGYSWLAFYDKRISIDEIIGKSIVIHSMRDDFTSQPSGDSGTKIGCGVIQRF